MRLERVVIPATPITTSRAELNAQRPDGRGVTTPPSAAGGRGYPRRRGNHMLPTVTLAPKSSYAALTSVLAYGDRRRRRTAATTLSPKAEAGGPDDGRADAVGQPKLVGWESVRVQRKPSSVPDCWVLPRAGRHPAEPILTRAVVAERTLTLGHDETRFGNERHYRTPCVRVRL